MDNRLADLRYGNLDYPYKQWESEPVKLFRKGWQEIELPPPPANDSKTTRAEVGTIEYLLAEVYPDKREEITRQDHQEFQPIDYEYPGTIELEFINLLAAEGMKLPEEEQLRIARIASDLTVIGLFFKKQYDRPRPFQVMNALGRATTVPPSETARSPSYPSTHALIGTFLADYLAANIRSKGLRDKVLKLGSDLGNNRVIAGWHFPSDVQAGVDLASALRPYFKR